MERCPFCQTTLLNAFALTCKQCGRRVQPELSIDTQQVTLATEPPVLSCPACGEVIPSGARFCGKCGQVVKHQKNGEVALAVSHEVSLTVQRQEDTRKKVSSSVAAPSTSEREVHDHVFISYSRKQFYFAEALTLGLQQQGISAWFDVQRLTPGASWEQELQHSLDSCQGLVLIASQSALASNYVRNEWQAVLAANKPVYVVLCEAIDLPTELRDATIIDMRKSFDTKLSVLADSIRTGVMHRDPLPRSNVLRLPMCLPPSVWLVLIASWNCVVTCTVLTALFASALLLRFPVLPEILTMFSKTASRDIGFFIVFLIEGMGLITSLLGVFAFCAYFLYLAAAFTYRRRFRYADFRWGLLASSLIYLLICYAVWHTLVQATQLWDVPVLLLVLVSSLLSLSACFVMARSADIMRWLPTGVAPEILRVRCNPRRVKVDLGTGTSSQGRRKTYYLHYDPEDEYLANGVRSVLVGKFREIYNENYHADIHIAIMSNRTEQVWIDNLLESIPSLVCVAATSIRIPSDEVLLRQRQWIDDRRQTRRTLEMMPVHLSSDPSISVDYKYPVVPESLEIPVYPHKVGYIGMLLKGLAAFALGNAAVGFLSVALGVDPIILGTAVSDLFIGVFLYWIAFKLLSRTISSKAFWLAVSIALVSLLLLGIPNIVLLVGIITLVISLVSLFIARWSIRSWLPGGDQWRLSRRRGQTLGLPIQKLFGWNDIYYLSYLFLYGFYIYEKIIQDILNK
jgi:hypothetical protein